jgi:methylated-DNA-protein-cysteine methyltransferase related protein
MKTEKENYFDLVYQVVRLIPSGRVTTYGAIAHYLGLKSGARMVGYAMNAAHALQDVPAHRVVNREGVLTGKHHFETPEKMAQLLKAEGVQVVDDKITHFTNHFWNPNSLLLDE